MDRFVIEGGVPLRGEVRVAGAKNAVLKMMAAAILTDEPVVLRNVPQISDVTIMRETMADIGFGWTDVESHGLELRDRGPEWLFVPLEAAMKMRSSFILLGPLLARHGRVIISNPGGDRIGRRPVDLHVEAMHALGAEIDYRNGYYFARATQLRGARIAFPYVTVMGTENALLAACLATGTTVIENAAQEPEVDDLVAMLQAMGARIERIAAHVLEVEGVDALYGVEHTVLGDRIEAGTFAVAAASTGGEVTVSGFDPAHLGAFNEVLTEMGVEHEPFAANGDSGLRVRGAAAGSYRPVAIETEAYPGLATDLQAPLAVLMTQAAGESTIHETIYSDRLEYTAELVKMGAQIEVADARHARIAGPTPLHGRTVQIPDLRAGATLVVAALSAEGTSTISGVEHVDRGYEAFESKLVGLGARIGRVSD
jgi:UDP-N-acetylglucosamine 1-carboxyvinyltransferase